MAEVSHGPVTTMRNSIHAFPAGTMCDDHPDRPAYKRVQGETDSFGCEFVDFCEECFKAYQVEVAKPIISCCDWCKASDVEIKETRDYTEGLSGPVYDVCAPCRQKQAAELSEELAAQDERDGRRHEEDEREEEIQRELDQHHDDQLDEIAPFVLTSNSFVYIKSCTEHLDRAAYSFRDYMVKPITGYCRECHEAEVAKL